MTPEARIIALEMELIDTRKAAVAMLLRMAEGVTKTPEGRQELAQAFEGAARDADPVTARLARLVAAAIRTLN